MRTWCGSPSWRISLTLSIAPMLEKVDQYVNALCYVFAIYCLLQLTVQPWRLLYLANGNFTEISRKLHGNFTERSREVGISPGAGFVTMEIDLSSPCFFPVRYGRMTHLIWSLWGAVTCGWFGFSWRNRKPSLLSTREVSPHGVC